MKENSVKCTVCGEMLHEDNIMEYDGDPYCEDCFMDNFAECHHCGRIEPIERTTWLDHYQITVCEDCLDEYYHTCCDCGEVIHRWDSRYLNGEFYCEDCFQDVTCWCEVCEEYVHEDDWNSEYDCCQSCAEERASKLIWSYHSHSFRKVGVAKPSENIFHKGVELEVENRSDVITNNDMARIIHNLNENLLFERDGSLEHGFEIITQPHTFEKFAEIRWKDILESCSENGFRSHNTSTCGLHIHYSWQFFGMTREEQDENVGKVIAFYERNIDQMLKFSRRTWGEFQHWARGYDTNGDVEVCKNCAKKGNDRYHYINMTNSNTVEFRLGRGTLNYDSFMAWNDFHDCLVRNVKNVSYEDIDNYRIWLDGIKEDTLEYLANRNCFADVVKMFFN